MFSQQSLTMCSSIDRSFSALFLRGAFAVSVRVSQKVLRVFESRGST